MSKTCVHSKQCNIAYSDEHNDRTKSLGYVNTQRSSLNEAVMFDPRTLPAILADIAKQVRAHTGRKLQKNAKPIREEVIVCKADTTIADLQAYVSAHAKRFGTTPLRLFLHRDEGHEATTEDVEEGNAQEVGEWIGNFHAHFVYAIYGEGTKWRNGKLSRSACRALQDMAAQYLRMERGVQSSAQHVEAQQYRAKKSREAAERQEARLAKVNEATAKAETAAKVAQSTAELQETRLAEATQAAAAAETRAAKAKTDADQQEVRLAEATRKTDQVKTTRAAAKIAANEAKTAIAKGAKAVGDSLAKTFGISSDMREAREAVQEARKERDAANERADRAEQERDKAKRECQEARNKAEVYMRQGKSAEKQKESAQQEIQKANERADRAEKNVDAVIDLASIGINDQSDLRHILNGGSVEITTIRNPDSDQLYKVPPTTVGMDRWGRACIWERGWQTIQQWFSWLLRGILDWQRDPNLRQMKR